MLDIYPTLFPIESVLIVYTILVLELMLRKRLTTNDDYDDEGLFRIFTKLIRIESMRE